MELVTLVTGKGFPGRGTAVSKVRSKVRRPRRRLTVSTPPEDQLGDYLRQLQGQADHIYSPGYWLSGQMGFPLARGGRSLGLVFLVTGGLPLVAQLLAMVRSERVPTGSEIVVLIFALLVTLAGLRLSLRRKSSP